MRPKKSLGQNFLNSSKAISEIVSAGEVKKGDTVLEIGPGKGVLTRALMSQGAHVVAIEKDDQLIPYLNELFKEEIKQNLLTLIHADILDLVDKEKMSPNLTKLLGKGYKLIANIPYYITGEIIERFHTITNSPTQIVLLVQKEVGERIIAKNKKESILSIAVKVYGEPKIVSVVPRGAFHPVPNVDSVILSITNIKHFGDTTKEKLFFTILKLAFSQKRKRMLGNLKNIDPKVFEKISSILAKNNFDQNTRAEDIPVSIWKLMI